MSQSESKAKIYYKEQGMEKPVDQTVKSLGKIVSSEGRIKRTPNLKEKSQQKEENLENGEIIVGTKENTQINLVSNIQQERKISPHEELGLFENGNGVNILFETIQAPQIALQNLVTLIAKDSTNVHHTLNNDVVKVSSGDNNEVLQNVDPVICTKANQQNPIQNIPISLPQSNQIIAGEHSDSKVGQEKNKLDISIAPSEQENVNLASTNSNVDISNQIIPINQQSSQDKNAPLLTDKIDQTEDVKQVDKDPIE